MCTKDYKIPDTNWVIEKNTHVEIPIGAMQRDAKYYEQPNEFMPERFDESVRASKTSVQPFFTFGDGPRVCLGLRLGKLQTKIALVSLLQKYKFELDARHLNKELEFDKRSFVPVPIGGINLKIKSR